MSLKGTLIKNKYLYCGRNLGANNQLSELLFDLRIDLGYVLYKRTNVTARGKAAKNSGGFNIGLGGAVAPLKFGNFFFCL